MSERKLISGRYEVLRELGRGGMGLVWLAFDHRLETEVAIKQVRPELAKDSGDKDSLIKEARILARLSHPAIVRLFDLADTEYGLLMILEYVCGPNLQQVLNVRRVLHAGEVLHVMKQVCDGLASAHAGQIIHRDLKPPNLLLSLSGDAREAFKMGVLPDQVLGASIKITDFGISKLLAARKREAEEATRLGGLGTVNPELTAAFAGTPSYMAPEQFRGEPPTPMTDVYALGVITFQLISGRLPLAGGDPAYMHLMVAPPRLEGCPPGISAAVAKALEKHPKDRFASVGEFYEALSGPGPRVNVPYDPEGRNWGPPLGEPKTTLTPPQRRAVTIGALAFLGLLLAAFSAWAWRQFRNEPDPSNPAANGLEAVYAPVRPGKGALIDLRYEMDPPQRIGSLPPANPETAVPPLWPPPAKGPRKPKVAWTATVDTNYEVYPWVAAVDAAGVVYAELKYQHTVWALRDGNVLWGIHPMFRTEDWRMTSAELSLRPDGRLWLTSCDGVTEKNCPAMVMNRDGKGGLLAAAAVPPAPPYPPPGMLASIRWDPVNDLLSAWPDNDRPLYRCAFRGGKPYIDAVSRGGEPRWSVEIDSACEMGAATAGGETLIAGTRRGGLYAISGGRLQWVYKTEKAIRSVHPLPNGDLLTNERAAEDRVACLRGGKVLWTIETPGSIDQGQTSDHHGWHLAESVAVDREGVAYFVVNRATTVVAAIGPDGRTLWKLDLEKHASLNGIRLDHLGRLFVAVGSSILCIVDQ